MNGSTTSARFQPQNSWKMTDDRSIDSPICFSIASSSGRLWTARMRSSNASWRRFSTGCCSRAWSAACIFASASWYALVSSAIWSLIASSWPSILTASPGVPGSSMGRRVAAWRWLSSSGAGGSESACRRA